MSHGCNRPAPRLGNLDAYTRNGARGGAVFHSDNPARDYDRYAATLIHDHATCRACKALTHVDALHKGVCVQCHEDKFYCDGCLEWHPWADGFVRLDELLVCRAAHAEWAANEESPSTAAAVPGSVPLKRERTMA